MDQLPLFPLRTVLFPGMPLMLHIFESRYKVMLKRCIEQRDPFGAVLIKRGMEALGPLGKPHSVGCTARIVQVERLEKGRMNIVAVGEDRFRIQALEQEQGYLVGEVEYLSYDKENPSDLAASSSQLRPWVKRYLHLLAEANLLKGEVRHLPFNPMELAYLSAFLLQVPAPTKQELLSAEKGTDLLELIHQLYRRELALLKNILLVEGPGDEDRISLN